MIEDKRLKNKIFVYSARKIAVNAPAEYSVLNPDTNSLSPSAKSKGARLSSARQVIIQMGAITGIRIEGVGIASLILCSSSSDLKIIRINKRVKDILTSYEMVWATPRNAPKREYFEFEAHPLPSVVYAPILEIAKKNITEKGIREAL